jgi:hypothetical protein
MSLTSLIALSTPEGSANYFSKLLTTVDKKTGESLFYVCNCILICEDCLKLSKEEQVQCKHVKQTAFWLNTEKTDKYKLLLAHDPAAAIREFAGQIEDDYVVVFPKEVMKRVFDLPPMVYGSSPKYVFVTVDPSGGGVSQMAMCIGYYDEATEVFLVSLSMCHVFLSCAFEKASNRLH